MMRHLVLLVAATAAALSCAGRSDKVAEKPIPVRVESVEPYTLTGGARYSASVEPVTRVDLAFKVGGYVSEVAQVRDESGRRRIVQAGDLAPLGMVLARLRRGDYEEKVRQARSQLGEAEAGLRHAELDMERAQDLFDGDSLTKPERDAAEARRNALRAKKDGAQALVAEAEIALSDSELRSPISGVIVRRFIEVGSLVGPGSPGFSIADTRRVKVVFGAPDTTVKALRIGQVQEISTEALPGRRFAGRISMISPVADLRSRVFDVKIMVPNDDGELKPGMIASLEIASTTARSPLAVPLNAVIRGTSSTEGYAVYVVDGTEPAAVARLRPVRLGDVQGNRIVVEEGLAAGEIVIVAGVTIVRDGAAVRVVP